MSASETLLPEPFRAKMRRQPERWAAIAPYAVAEESKMHVVGVLQDAQCDIATLVKACDEMSRRAPSHAALLAEVESGTPAALWRIKGEPDYHGTRYDCERAKLVGGDMTDDQLANAVFVDPTMVNLTAAKDRIRWLSRALERARAALEQSK